MPPIRSLRSLNLEHQEGRILLAIQAFKNGDFTSIRAAASAFDVNRCTLTRRLNGTPQRAILRANLSKMTQLEEESLVNWIISMDSRGFAPRKHTVCEMANLLLADRGDTVPQTVGVNWIDNFIARTPAIKLRLSRRYNYKHAECEDPKLIRKWFDTVQRTIIEYGITDDDIWNFDETGFSMGMTSRSHILTSSERKESQRKLLMPGNREWVTVIEYINRSQALPPTVILKGKTFDKIWFNMVPKDWRLEISDNGWTNDQIGLRWLQKSFIPKVRNISKGSKILLILDGHRSHLTGEFDRMCRQNDII